MVLMKMFSILHNLSAGSVVRRVSHKVGNTFWCRLPCHAVLPSVQIAGALACSAVSASDPSGLLQLATSEPCGSKSATACRKASTFCCVYVHAHARTCVCVYACARVCMSVFMFESVLCSPLLTTHTVGSNHQEGIASIDA